MSRGRPKPITIETRPPPSGQDLAPPVEVTPNMMHIDQDLATHTLTEPPTMMDLDLTRRDLGGIFNTEQGHPTGLSSGCDATMVHRIGSIAEQHDLVWLGNVNTSVYGWLERGQEIILIMYGSTSISLSSIVLVREIGLSKSHRIVTQRVVCQHYMRCAGLSGTSSIGQRMASVTERDS